MPKTFNLNYMNLATLNVFCLKLFFSAKGQSLSYLILRFRFRHGTYNANMNRYYRRYISVQTEMDFQVESLEKIKIEKIVSCITTYGNFKKLRRDIRIRLLEILKLGLLSVKFQTSETIHFLEWQPPIIP